MQVLRASAAALGPGAHTQSGLRRRSFAHIVGLRERVGSRWEQRRQHGCMQLVRRAPRARCVPCVRCVRRGGCVRCVPRTNARAYCGGRKLSRGGIWKSWSAYPQIARRQCPARRARVRRASLGPIEPHSTPLRTRTSGGRRVGTQIVQGSFAVPVKVASIVAFSASDRTYSGIVAIPKFRHVTRGLCVDTVSCLGVLSNLLFSLLDENGATMYVMRSVKKRVSSGC